MGIFHSTSSKTVKIARAGAIVALVGVSAAMIGASILGTSGVRSRSQSKTYPIKSVPISLLVGKPLTHYNMTIFPVYSGEKRKARRVGHQYLTLNDALKKKQLFVKEKPDADVSQVHLTNVSKKSVYLMAGDIILGGQQDREIARDTIVPAKSKNFVAEVFCVEEGRWEGKSKFSSGETASSSLRFETQRYKEQDKVWSKVKKEANYTKSESSSGTYRAVATNKVTQAQIAAYTIDFSKRLNKDKKALGLVVAINGEMRVADVFADPQLFQKQLPTLLKSYALDAVQEKTVWAKMPKQPEPSLRLAQQFLKDGETGGQRASEKNGATINSERENKTTVTFDSLTQSTSRNAKDARLLHRNIYKKQ